MVDSEKGLWYKAASSRAAGRDSRDEHTGHVLFIFYYILSQTSRDYFVNLWHSTQSSALCRSTSSGVTVTKAG